MEIIQKYSNSFIIVALLLSLLPSLIHASEKSRASVYLCTDSEIILPSSTLHEKITTTKHLIADLSLLVTDEDQLYFKRLFKNKGLFYSPVTDMGDSRFDVVTFENSVLAISTKIGDEIQNERYLCMDACDVIVHLLKLEVREFYGLERMWSPSADEETIQVSAD